MKGSLVVGLALLVAGCAAGGPADVAVSRHDVRGTLTIADSALGGICVDRPGYGDIAAGASVVLRDESGTVIGTGRLGPGTGDGSDCRFAFTIPAMPERAFYSVEVAHRGQVTVSLADLRAAGWQFALALGR